MSNATKVKLDQYFLKIHIPNFKTISKEGREKFGKLSGRNDPTY